MANPQTDDGYTPIANEIVEALMKINLSAYESRVLWFLFRKTYGWNKKTDRISLSQFSQYIGLDRRLIHRAITSLSSKQMIVIYKDDTFNVSYGFQKDYDKWNLSSKKMTVIDSDDKLSSIQMTKLSSIQIPTKETTKETTKEKTYTAEFLKFYQAYPKHKKRDDAWKAWKSMNGTRPSLEILLSAIEAQKKSEDWTKKGGQFIPYPASWLRSGQWNDEIETENFPSEEKEPWEV